MAVMTGTNRNRRRPETESAEEAERHREATARFDSPDFGLPVLIQLVYLLMIRINTQFLIINLSLNQNGQ